MKRRRFIALSATCPCTALAGCAGVAEAGGAVDPDNGSDGPTDDDAGKGEDDGEHADRPNTDHELEVHDERSVGHVFWVDRDGRMYGGRSDRVLVSDDWWETTEVLYSFDRHGDTNDYVQTVVVPDSGRVLVGVGGRADKTTGRLELLDEEFEGSETVYEFEYGRTSNSMGHAVYGEVVVVACYGRSDFEGGNHPNEVILSTDGGESFELVLEAELHTRDAPNLHIHDVEYDPYAERVWVAVGDGGNTQIYWSDDLGGTWERIGEGGEAPMVTQVAAFEDCVVFGTDGAPEGIVRWERDGPNDEPEGVGDLVHPHVQIETDPDDDRMEMYARRRWHVREDDGRELCLMPFGFSPMHPDASESVVLGSVDGDEWFELYRVDGREVLLTNVMGPLSMDGDRRTLVSDSNQEGYHVDATVPEFWN